MQERKDSKLDFTDEEIKVLLEFFPDGICAFDLEMTGLSPLFDKIIEIAGCRILPDGTWDTYHTLVNPLIPIPEHTIEFHKLTNEDLRDQPTLKKPLSDFVEFYGNMPLLAHNVMFDASFLIRGIHEYHFPISLSSIYDSCRMARAIYKKVDSAPKNFKLSTLVEYYGFEFSHHVALDDAIACLKIYARCLIEYKEKHSEKNLKVLSFLFKLNSFKKAEDYILPNKLKDLKEFVQSRTGCYIKYKGGSAKGKLRPIKPISVLPMPQGLILYAECGNSKMNKYFQVKKIQAVSLEGPGEDC